jgi:putative ABC transport system ATP-binding protein
VEKIMSFLTLQNVAKEYKTEAGSFVALSEVDFELCEGEFVVILGPSGAGKTTLLNLLGGMDNLTSGKIMLDGEEVSALNKKQLTEYRRNAIGFVFQFYNLMPNLTALENVELATEICANALSPIEVLKQVGLESKQNNFPAQLSGGEQQRVSIARAVAKNPKLLLCDEPTGALDYVTGKNILRLLYDVSKNNKKLVVVVTHNQALKAMADKVISIKNGKIEKVETNQNPVPIEEIEW